MFEKLEWVVWKVGLYIFFNMRCWEFGFGGDHSRYGPWSLWVMFGPFSFEVEFPIATSG